MSSIQNEHHRGQLEVDARVGNALIEVKFSVDALRTFRTSLMQLAYVVGEDPVTHGYLVLVDSPISVDRLRQEWERAATVLRPDILQRLTICLRCLQERIIGIPNDPDADTQRILSEVIEVERGKTPTHATRTDYSFVIQKLLLLQWLTSTEPVTSGVVGPQGGLLLSRRRPGTNSLGSLVERHSIAVSFCAGFQRTNLHGCLR